MNKKRLVIIDDEPEIGEIIREVAEEMDYDVIVTQFADEFWSAYETLQPTVIIVDIVMPDIDGIELLRHLAERSCEAKVLIMSGYSKRYMDSAEKLGEALGLPKIGRLTKPFRVKDLRDALA